MESCEASVLAYIRTNHQRDMTTELNVAWTSLGFESLALLDVVLYCERQYAVDVTDTMMATIQTMRDLIRCVDAQRLV